MSYNDFLNQFVGVISSFVSWLSSIANVLIHNYFFITLFGLALFVSLFWLVYYIFYDFIYDIIHKYDEYNDLYKDYELKKQVQSDYLNEHYDDEYDYLYRKKVLSYQVLNGVYQNNRDLIVDNKINNLDCNIDALKLLKQSKLVDNDDSNDNDVDMIVPNPPIHLSSFDELKRAELQQLHNELIEDNNRLIDDIIKNNECINIDGHIIHTNGYALNNDNFRPIDGKIVNIHTGEVACDTIVPLPSGSNYINSLTDEQKKEIDDFNDLVSKKMTHNYDGRYGNFDEDLDSQLFS